MNCTVKVSVESSIRRDEDGNIKKVRELTINCVHNTNENILNNPTCMKCCIKQISSDVTRIVFRGKKFGIILDEKGTAILKDLKQLPQKIKKEIHLDHVLKNDCPHFSDCYKQLHNFIKSLISENEGNILGDPVGAYSSLIREIHSQSVIKNARKCAKCNKKYLSLLHKIKSLLENSLIIKEYLNLKIDRVILSREELYSLLLPVKYIAVRDQFSPTKILPSSEVVETYEVPPFTIKIYSLEDSDEFFYFVETLSDHTLYYPIIEEIVRELKANERYRQYGEDFFELEKLIELQLKEASRTLKVHNPSLSDELIKKLSELATYKSLGLFPVIVFLLDDEIEEFYLDQPNSPVYLDHRKWGRCVTNVTLTKNDVDRLITHLRAKSGFRLDELNPSLKTEISSKLFHIRASIDIPPLAVDGVKVDIRKLRHRPYTLPELIANKTISADAAAYFYLCLTRKINITIIGRPGDGKTTLANALDILTPKSWRKITIEDAVESISQIQYGKHQCRLRVKPLESIVSSEEKSREIVKLLHRSPDWILLSEIQTAEDSAAMFHALSAGLTGLQTCHADSSEDILIRWNIHHHIPAVSFNQLGVLINIRRVMGEDNKRRVIEVCELDTSNKLKATSLSDLTLIRIFEWDPEADYLKRKYDLFETPAVKTLRRYEPISRESFTNEFTFYKNIFQKLTEMRMFQVDKNIELFHKIHFLKHKLKDGGVTDWDTLQSQLNRILEGLK
ncbi:MAG: ATPase, T2SS/T4P/T4SS family [Candidatus Odinarchaeia archaeon]